MTKDPIKVLIVEDSLSVQQLLEKIINDDPSLHVCGIVSDGKEALDFIKKTRPDVITMDIMMPKMNGIDATRMIMMDQPIPIVIISGKYTKEDVTIGFEAMEAGAVSIMEKPPGIKDPSFPKIAGNIQKILRSVSGIKLIARRPYLNRKKESSHKYTNQRIGAEAIAIGSSLGGPQALKQVLMELPENFPLPIFVVQHIASGFGQGLIEWLNHSISLNVVAVKEGEVPIGGNVYISPDDKHLVITKNKRLSLLDSPPVNGLRPAVAKLFSSVSDSYGANCVGILLTGMGSDGSNELLELYKQGAITIAQNEETCIAYGMPGSAVKLGAAKHILSLTEISEFLQTLNDFHLKAIK